MKKLFCRKTNILIQRYFRFLRKLTDVCSVEFKKRSCTMILRFSSNDFDKFETDDSFVTTLDSLLGEMCKLNNLNLEGHILCDLKLLEGENKYGH